jgi:uridylate kinase
MENYKRVLLKLSGEMFGGESGTVLSKENVSLFAGEIASLHNAGKEVGVVIGGGNIFRGILADEFNIERSDADHMGMLATCINGLALQAVLEKNYNLHTRVMTAVHMPELAEPYIMRKALKHLSKKRIVIFAGGTGNPLFTTDTAAALRARELGCQILLKATKVSGVYSSDPKESLEAKKYSKISYLEVISKRLNVMDATAITMCMESNMPILVFKADKKGSVLEALKNPSSATFVCGDS